MAVNYGRDETGDCARGTGTPGSGQVRQHCCDRGGCDRRGASGERGNWQPIAPSLQHSCGQRFAGQNDPQESARGSKLKKQQADPFEKKRAIQLVLFEM